MTNPIDRVTVREALEAFLAENGFSTDAYDAPTVEIPLGPVTVTLPNTEGRKVLVRWHDLHHVATGYGTDMTGEAEIGAWEIRAGCTNLAGYVYNGMAVALGLLIAPIRTVRAFLRGEGTRTLYRVELRYEDALEMDIVELRARLGLPAEGVAAGPAKLHTAAPKLTA